MLIFIQILDRLGQEPDLLIGKISLVYLLSRKLHAIDINTLSTNLYHQS
jgi:hypothetical protein